MIIIFFTSSRRVSFKFMLLLFGEKIVSDHCHFLPKFSSKNLTELLGPLQSSQLAFRVTVYFHTLSSTASLFVPASFRPCFHALCCQHMLHFCVIHFEKKSQRRCSFLPCKLRSDLEPLTPEAIAGVPHMLVGTTLVILPHVLPALKCVVCVKSLMFSITSIFWLLFSFLLFLLLLSLVHSMTLTSSPRYSALHVKPKAFFHTELLHVLHHPFASTQHLTLSLLLRSNDNTRLLMFFCFLTSSYAFLAASVASSDLFACT